MQERIRIPIPDPLGILGDLTKDMPVVLFDPLKNAGEMELAKAKAKQESEVREGEGNESIVDTKIEKYRQNMEQALINAPCKGCKAVALSGLTSVEIYQEMSQEGKSKSDFSDKDIEEIKKRVEERYKEHLI